ncbi:hypothetical protein SI65_08402 [Aspergillus cristatus]|uniref:Zn(2)-C6 fungal-type domain-containing protein n=1 Tax=Aspergillus cristatus TaxID=573508 RepID=A0A1E3B509_ASPCR|nr:hypothetical protein SI65_10330 [Aspergillus cristatus]ODM15968.1 hypothetical protein SI65_08402 [Aspergillus cristatus]
MAADRPKRARAGACKNCRVRKRRCVPSDNGDECVLCQSLSIPCSLSQNYTEPEGPVLKRDFQGTPRQLAEREKPLNGASLSSFPATAATAAPSSFAFSSHALRPVKPQRSPLVTTPVVLLELVSLYFRFVHNIAHTLFHEASFIRRFNEGRASLLHVHAMCALSARYSQNQVFNGTPPGSRGQVYAAEATRLLQGYLGSPSLESTQACVLIGHFMGGEGDLKAKHTYFGLAKLHAENLSLWAMPHNLTVVHREERRRTWLSVRIADHWTAVDTSVEPAPFPHGRDALPAVDDIAFHTFDPNLLREDRASCNMWAHMAGTLDIFARISILLARLSRSVISFDTYCREVPLLTQRLEKWADGLPEELKYNISNLTSFANKGLGRTFLSMHIGYYHFRQMLYFPFLDARANRSTSIPTDGAAQCKSSAAMVSEIVQYAMRFQNCELDYYIYGYIAVVSSCVHLHTLLLSEDPSELWTARQRLVSNFEYLMSLKILWPMVNLSVARLRIFEDFCRNSMSDPFALDNWMARFITEHASIPPVRKQSTLPSLEPVLVDSATACVAGLNGHGGLSGTDETGSTGAEWGVLSTLLSDRSLTSEAVVNNALDWLLE